MGFLKCYKAIFQKRFPIYLLKFWKVRDRFQQMFYYSIQAPCLRGKGKFEISNNNVFNFFFRIGIIIRTIQKNGLHNTQKQNYRLNNTTSSAKQITRIYY